MKSVPVEKWEKEFEEKYVGEALDCIPKSRWKEMKPEVISFISQAIAEVVEAEELKYLRRFEQKADEVRNKAILEERRRIVSRIEEEKSKGYEANTILEGLIAELKIGSLINQKNV